MQSIDLTLPIPAAAEGRALVRLEELKIRSGGAEYTGMIYHFSHNSMAGTYIDFPGHIKETDDGLDAASYPVERLYRVDATVLRLDRESGSGAVHADELAAALAGPATGGALIVNALGTRRFDEIEERTVWFAKDAVRWIIDAGVHLLASDIYESTPVLTGVFSDLFSAGVSTVCCPVNLHLLTAPRVKLTVLPARYRTATQLPCRVVAELDETKQSL